MPGIQTIKRAIIAPMFQSDDLREEVARFEQAYFQLAQQVNQIQSHIQVFLRTWGAAVSPQVITMDIPQISTSYAALAIPTVNVGAFWCDTPTTTTFNFNMGAPAIGGAFFVVVLAV